MNQECREGKHSSNKDSGCLVRNEAKQDKMED